MKRWSGSESRSKALLKSIPPAEVSRVLLLFCVAAGALVSIATKGTVSGFAGGFAVGAGTALVFSRLRAQGPAAPPAERQS